MTLAVVLQVRGDSLCVLLWQRAGSRFEGAWSLPGRLPRAGRHALERSIRAQLARKVDVSELSCSSSSRRSATRTATPASGSSPPPTSGSSRAASTRAAGGHRLAPVDGLPAELAFDHGPIVLAGRERLRAKLSYTNIGFALAPESFTMSELSSIYTAALGYPVDPTNLRRVLERRGLLEATGERRSPGRGGGRPAAVYRFGSRELAVTDPFAVLRPPTVGSSSRLTSSAGAECVSAPTLM